MRAIIFMIALIVGMNLPSTASAQVSIGVNLPGVSIGINLPVYPDFVPVPGYPVYYAPRVDSNLFFYDGLYWVYAEDNWYASSWYNGPWDMVEPGLVPYFVLRVPVLYYRRPPVYFQQWDRRQPPRWGEHWGGGWEQNHRDWDRWDRSRPQSRAPLPVYQRQYSRDRYPSADEQRKLQDRHYRYQPRETVDRQLLRGPQQQRAQQQQQEQQRQRTQQQQQEQQRQRTQQTQQQEQRRQRTQQQEQQRQRTQQTQQQTQQRQRTQQQARPAQQQQQQRTQQKAQPAKGKNQRAKGNKDQGNGDQRQRSGPPN